MNVIFAFVLCENYCTGEGVYSMSNGDVYEGEYHLDKKHGYGKFVSEVEGTYEVISLCLDILHIHDLPAPGFLEGWKKTRKGPHLISQWRCVQRRDVQ